MLLKPQIGLTPRLERKAPSIMQRERHAISAFFFADLYEGSYKHRMKAHKMNCMYQSLFFLFYKIFKRK